MPERNFDLIEKVIEQVTTQPETHDQSFWIGIDWGESDFLRSAKETDRSYILEVDKLNLCGTTACLAGWAHILSGGKIYYDTRAATFLAGNETGPRQWSSFPIAARKAMGLTGEEAEDIFYTTDDERAIQKLKAILAERDEVNK